MKNINSILPIISISVSRDSEGKAHLAFGGTEGVTTEIKGLEAVRESAAKAIMNKLNTIRCGAQLETPEVSEETTMANEALLMEHAMEELDLEDVVTKSEVMVAKEKEQKHLGMLSAVANVTADTKIPLVGIRQHEQVWECNLWREALTRVNVAHMYPWITSVAPKFNPDEVDAYTKWAEEVAISGIDVTNEFGETMHLVKLGVGANAAKEGRIYFCPVSEGNNINRIRATLIRAGILGIEGITPYDNAGRKIGMSHIKETAAVCYGSNVGYRTNAQIGSDDSILFVNGDIEAELTRIEASVREATAKIVGGKASQDLTDGMMIICGKVAKELGLSVQQIRFMGVKGAAHCLPYTFLRVVTDMLPWINWSEYVLVDAEGQEWSFNPSEGKHDLNKVEIVLTSSALKVAKEKGFTIAKYQAAAAKYWSNRLTILGTNHTHRGGYTSLQQMQALNLSEEDLKNIVSIKDKMERLGEFANAPEEWAAGEYPLAGIMPGFMAFEEIRIAAERAWEYERINDAASRVIAYDATEKCAVDLRTLLCIFMGVKVVPAMRTRQVYCAKVPTGLVATMRDPNASEWDAQVAYNHIPAVSGYLRHKYYAIDAIHVGIVDVVDGKLYAYDMNLFLQLDYDGDKLRLCSIPEVVKAVLRMNMKHPIGAELGKFGNAPTEFNTIESQVRSEVGACLGSEMGKPANLYFMVQSNGLPQSIKDRIAAAYPDNADEAIEAVTEWVKFWLEILTWLLIDSSKHGSDRIAEVLNVMMAELRAEMMLPIAKRADRKGLVAARNRERMLKTGNRHAPDITFRDLQCVSGTPFATTSSGNASDMNYVNFMSVEMPIIDYRKYEFNVNVLLTMPAKMTELVRPFNNDTRDALSRWNAMCDRYFGFVNEARNIRDQFGAESPEYKEARKKASDFLYQVRAWYFNTPDYVQEILYNQDTLAAFGCLLGAYTDKNGKTYPCGRIQWERGKQDKKVAPAIDYKTGAYRSRGLSLWMKLWGDKALEVLKSQWTAEELKAICVKQQHLAEIYADDDMLDEIMVG